MNNRLEDKVAVVTGGAMGNGLGIVKVFLEAGATVVIIDYSDELSNTLKSLSNYKGRIFGFKGNLRDKVTIKRFVNTVIAKFKKIDILVNNAGICELESFDKMSDDVRDKHFDINIVGTWNITKEVIPYMIQRNKGSIINLSSVTGPLVADSGEVAYATTKAALIGFTKSLAVEYVKNNIRVNSILPGYIYTPMVENMAQASNPVNPQQVIDGITSGIPMKRLGTIEEIGYLALFLACDESSYITGQEIVIDGGSTLPETMSVGV